MTIERKMISIGDGRFPERFTELCQEYYEVYMEDPPCPVSSHNRMNSLLAGTRIPTIDELIAISEEYNVSINYLLTGDTLYPCLHRLKKEHADQVLDIIERLEPKPEY